MINIRSIKFLGFFFVFIILFVSLRGLDYIFQYPSILIQSTTMVVVLNFIFAYFIKQERIKGDVKIAQGRFVSKMLKNKKLKYKYLLLFFIIEILILAYAYSPGGEEEQRLIGSAIIIPLLLSAVVISGE